MNAPNQVSFLPDDYLRQKAQRRTNGICAALFLVVMLAIGSAFAITERSLSALEKRCADVNHRYAEAARPIEQFHKLQEKQRQMDHQAALTASLLEKVPRTFILAEITNALPQGVSLLDFTLDARPRARAAAVVARTQYELKKAELEAKRNPGGAEPRVYDVSLKLTGISDNDVQVAAFINQLSQSPLFKDVNLVVSDEFVESHDKVRKFQIEMMLNPDADVDHLRGGAFANIRD